ncbi:MAG: hypothetical protein A2817_03425 [Candidatus Yanofskybacteria bacterium RIFCSPHIGHO2_01_FULL_39_8b]|uniref:Gfo/Idh/MocA-like oxidoreductase N-terminal domain-containing protein n=1 Tax=Candidatus Yanofskybacteria bacterium RIFCSPHIGHO2_01_FULL_39_8b TaxID=1802659 RepID=A0A1F8EH66_9BACT|nr:MAG: hypothetical protein A2817_03425 [Candidatus Yanofskybacteria bacterium RIFCSPHIGHO2_01_FULL_39_8b]
MILLVGAGYMGQEYAKVLKSINVGFIVVGRSEESAKLFEDKIQTSVITGGLIKWLEPKPPVPRFAIIATNEENLGASARELIRYGIKNILIEKPGGINLADIKKTQALANKHRTKIFIAYNRRFYASAMRAKEIIKKDGGALSFTFDFSERSHLIKNLNKPKMVKKNWLIMNSSHVIDMAFFLVGHPKKLYSQVGGKNILPWHPRGSIYSGYGIVNPDILFSYHANWQSPGNWKIELLTKKNKLIFMPLEELKIQRIGHPIENLKLNNELDAKFKPGLYAMTKSFLTNSLFLKTIENQLKDIEKIYNVIGSY